jgi:hypothetical protein
VIGFGVVTPLGLWATRGTEVRIEFATAALLCAIALIVFLGLRRAFARPPGTGWNLRYLALAVLGATLMTIPLHLRWIQTGSWALR